VSAPLEELVAKFKPALDVVAASVPAGTQDATDDQAMTSALQQAGLPAHLAQHWNNVPVFAQMLPVVAVAEQTHCDVAALVKVSGAVATELKVDWLITHLTELPTQSHWQSLQVDALYDDLYRYQCLFGAQVLTTAEGDFALWQKRNPGVLESWFASIEEVRVSGATDIALYALIVRRLADICSKLGC
jgi:glutamate dehydrogenase